MLRVESHSAKRLINLHLAWFSYRRHDVYIAKQSRLFAHTRIGSGTRINGPATIKGNGRAEIGKYCAIGDHLSVITSNHSLRNLNLQNALQVRITGEPPFVSEKSGVVVGHNVWIGDNVTLLPGVEVGNGAIIGAGSVVTRSIDAYEIHAGNPSKKIGERFSRDAANRLDRLQWWDWSIAKMQASRILFTTDFSRLTTQEVDQLIATLDDRSE